MSACTCSQKPVIGQHRWQSIEKKVCLPPSPKAQANFALRSPGHEQLWDNCPSAFFKIAAYEMLDSSVTHLFCAQALTDSHDYLVLPTMGLKEDTY